MRKQKLSYVLIIVLLTALFVFTACASTQPTSDVVQTESGEQAETGEPPASTDMAAEQASGTISLYTSIPQPIADRIQSDFMAKYPDITLDIFRAGTSDVVTKIATEKEAGAIQADLVWVAEPSTYEDFKSQDLLLQFEPDGANILDDAMKDPDGYYYAGRLITMIIGYNSSLEQAPTRWEDLTSEAFQGMKMGFPSPLRSGAAEAAVRAIVDKYGWEYFESFKANGGVQVQNNSAARDQLATGELQISATLDYILREANAEGSPIELVYPEDGTILIPSPIAILQATDNPEAAEVFVEYILSKEGQQALVELGNFYPVRDDVASPEGAPQLEELETMTVDWAALQEQREEVKQRWTEMFGE